MEEVFLQLWAEVARLQELCSEQGRLLQRLRARKGPVLGEWDLPRLHIRLIPTFIPRKFLCWGGGAWSRNVP